MFREIKKAYKETIEKLNKEGKIKKFFLEEYVSCTKNKGFISLNFPDIQSCYTFLKNEVKIENDDFYKAFSEIDELKKTVAKKYNLNNFFRGEVYCLTLHTVLKYKIIQVSISILNNFEIWRLNDKQKA